MAFVIGWPPRDRLAQPTINCMTYKLRPNLATRDIHGELVVVDMHSGAYHVFNEVGGIIWKGLAAAREPADILLELTGTFAVEAPQIKADFDRFIDQLKSIGLLE